MRHVELRAFSTTSYTCKNTTTLCLKRYPDVSLLPLPADSICTNSMRFYVPRDSLGCNILFVLETPRFMSKKQKTRYLNVQCARRKGKPPYTLAIKLAQPIERFSIDSKGQLPSYTSNMFLLTFADEVSRFPFYFFLF